MKNSKKNYYFAGIAAILLFTRLGLGTVFTSASDITPQSISAGVNNERTTRNLTSLSYNSDLAAAAAYKANDMVTRNYFAHVDPDGNYIWGKDAAEGYTPYSILGENLAINFPDTASLMAAWMDSPEHRANILNGSFQDQGAGVTAGNVDSGQYSIAIANEFGALVPVQHPAPKPTPPAPTPTQIPTPTPKPTPLPKPTSKPIPTPLATPVVTPTPDQTQIQPQAPTQLPPAVAITSDTQTGNGSDVAISGTAGSGSQLIISDIAFPENARVEATAGTDGTFTHKYTGLANGTHTFVAVLSDGSATSAPFSVVVSTTTPVAQQAAATAAMNLPAVDTASIHVQARALATGTALAVTVAVGGNPQNVTATVGGQSASLVLGASVYSGTVLLPLHQSLGGQKLTITAIGTSGQSTSGTIDIGNVPIQSEPGTSSLSNADLYSVFKGIAIVFGLVFAIFLIGDLIHSIKNRKLTANDIIRGSHVAILLIAVGTMLLVSWWH